MQSNVETDVIHRVSKQLRGYPMLESLWLMLISLFNSLFGCSHKRTTFPITPTRKSALPASPARMGTYVACLDCGKEFRYNWKEMRIGEPVTARVPATAATTTETFSPVHR
jgi:hypothetical protein